MSRRERERVAKTNAMRELERGHITYVARELGEERDISRGLGLRMASS